MRYGSATGTVLPYRITGIIIILYFVINKYVLRIPYSNSLNLSTIKNHKLISSIPSVSFKCKYFTVVESYDLSQNFMT